VLRPGKLLRMEGVRIGPGGTVGNTGPALHRLGVPVALMGKCGDDPFGRILLERLRALAPGAEGGMQVVPGENTSYTIVIAPPGIDRMFLHCPDANDTFGPEDVDLDVVGRARLFHGGPSCRACCPTSTSSYRAWTRSCSCWTARASTSLPPSTRASPKA